MKRDEAIDEVIIDEAIIVMLGIIASTSHPTIAKTL